MEANFLKPVFNFLCELAEHNRRDWFEQHRAEYQLSRERFDAFINAVIAAFQPVENLGGISAHDCVMRIYRDLRFSHDKSPYQTNMAASIARGGRHSARLPYYVHLAPHNQSFLAGGLYMPSSSQLTRFREQIVRDSAPFRAIVNEPRFQQMFDKPGGESLKTAPQGYSRDHPDLDLLRLKQITVAYPLPDALVNAPDIVDRVVEVFSVMKPFVDYLNETAVS